MVILGDEFRSEVDTLNNDLMLEKVELEILETLHDGRKKCVRKRFPLL
jgi:hypothetical protein